MFSNGFKNAADSLVEKELDLEFEEGCVPIQSVQLNTCTIDFTGVVQDLQNDFNKDKDEPVSITIKRKKSSLADTIKTNLTVSSVFGSLYHITNNSDMVDISNNNDTRYDLIITSLESEFCSDLFPVTIVTEMKILCGTTMLTSMLSKSTIIMNHYSSK